jgi:hypothetical protein
VVGCYEHDNEPMVSIKGEEFLDHLAVSFSGRNLLARFHWSEFFTGMCIE